jgi:hypothetical protein
MMIFKYQYMKQFKINIEIQTSTHLILVMNSYTPISIL